MAKKEKLFLIDLKDGDSLIESARDVGQLKDFILEGHLGDLFGEVKDIFLIDENYNIIKKYSKRVVREVSL